MSRVKRALTLVRAAKQPGADRSSWAAVLVLGLCVTVPAVAVVLAGYSISRDSHPTDGELTAKFLSHETDFQMLVKMLDSDRRTLPLGPGPFDLTDIVAAGASAARTHNYEALLTRIDARNFRYFPEPGSLAIESYLYLSRDEPQPLRYHRSYGWRGPGMYFVTGDYRLKGQWFIHHDGTVVVAFAPY